MPVIRHIPNDPTDMVLQGEQMRLVALAGGMHAASSPVLMSALMIAAVEPGANIVVEDGESYSPMHQDFTPYHSWLKSPFAGTTIANNAVISTPCGALYPHGIGNHIMNAFVQSTNRWVIAGVTRDNAGAALGNCRVVGLETGRIAVGQTPVVAETISDGAGNYSIEVALNSAHQVIAYLDGVPDVAGISLDTLTPAAV